MIWNRRLPLRYRCDVAVIGGGIAGVCAACAAAFEGAQVILVERFAVTGGNATIGGVANWSGETAGQGAIFDEIIAEQEAWNSIDPYRGPYARDRANRVFGHEILAVILQEMLLRHGVRLLLHTRFADVQRDGERLGPAVVVGPSGPEALAAATYIDASGGADLARAAGCGLLPPGPFGPLPPSMMFFVRECGEAATPQLPEGRFDPVREDADLPMTSIWPGGPGGKAIKLKVPGFDSADTESFTALEVRARQRIWKVLDHQQRRQGKAWLFDHCSSIIGLRETCRIAGDYVLTVDDLRAGRAFEAGLPAGSSTSTE